MNPNSPRRRGHELWWTSGPAILLLAVTFWVASRFVAPAPPQTIVIAAASKGSPYYRLAEQYRQFVAASGVTLEIRETSGSLENLSLVTDKASGVALAFLQGGIANAPEAPELRSIGRLFYEPLWIFYRVDAPFGRLSDLAGKRVLVGPDRSGTNQLARRLLAANGVTSTSATLINMELPDYVEALESGKAEAGFLVLAPEAKTIARLFNSSRVRLMNLSQADAYAQRYPYLSRVELRQGVFDLARNIPPVDTALVATMAALVVRDDLHSALVNLMTQAVVDGFTTPTLGPNGEAGVLGRVGQFPVTVDPEFPLAPEAARVYKSGPPFLQRYLPFWLATLADRMIVLLVPILGIGLPLVRFAPMLYTWRIRRRIFRWYGELRKVEAAVTPESSTEEFDRAFAEIDRIETTVDGLSTPLGFSNQVYDLREHINLVRRRLAAIRVQKHQVEPKSAAAGSSAPELVAVRQTAT
ncbi:MAG TPA: TAXI family TRAP transporter solute-binding subunit [Xanthobacteraceae bacterium]|nr:TAXI family TRAP transporter solute-binding subunit [Xanthobacteraceae bacterium]